MAFTDLSMLNYFLNEKNTIFASCFVIMDLKTWEIRSPVG